MKRAKSHCQEQTAIEEAIEGLFTAIQESEPEQVLKLLHPHVEWTPTIWSGEAMYRGQEGVHLWLSQFGENLEHLDIRIQEIQARGNRAAAHGIVFDTRGGQTFAVKVPWSFEMEDGLLRRGHAYSSWEEALWAAGLTEEPAPASVSAFGRVRQAWRERCPVTRRFTRH